MIDIRSSQTANRRFLAGRKVLQTFRTTTLQAVRGFRPSLRGTQGVKAFAGSARELAGCIITVYVAGVFAVNYRDLPIFHLNIRTECGPAFQSQLRGLTLRVLRLPTFRTDCYEALALITSEPGCPSFHRPGRQKKNQFYRYQFWSVVDYS
jgi:hypothetical protein